MKLKLQFSCFTLTKSWHTVALCSIVKKLKARFREEAFMTNALLCRYLGFTVPLPPNTKGQYQQKPMTSCRHTLCVLVDVTENWVNIIHRFSEKGSVASKPMPRSAPLHSRLGGACGTATAAPTMLGVASSYAQFISSFIYLTQERMFDSSCGSGQQCATFGSIKTLGKRS